MSWIYTTDTSKETVMYAVGWLVDKEFHAELSTDRLSEAIVLVNLLNGGSGHLEVERVALGIETRAIKPETSETSETSAE